MADLHTKTRSSEEPKLEEVGKFILRREDEMRAISKQSFAAFKEAQGGHLMPEKGRYMVLGAWGVEIPTDVDDKYPVYVSTVTFRLLGNDGKEFLMQKTFRPGESEHAKNLRDTLPGKMAFVCWGEIYPEDSEQLL
ncbi:MAG: hypothetical protein ACHQX1_02850 [Candidatus Micrarchaeales archaeon]